MARQLFSIDKWFVLRKAVTFCFRIVFVGVSFGVPLVKHSEKALLTV